MTFLPHSLSPDARFPRLARFGVARWTSRLLQADLDLVRKLNAQSSTLGKPAAVVISKLGNGWIYLFLAAWVFEQWGWQGGRLMALLAGVNAAALHLLYPAIKKRFKRPRPFAVDPSLPSLLRTLDEHSFPSGHAMTLVGVLTPIVLLWPAAFLSAVIMACGMFWSRVATGHHYPSDVLAGATLGAGLGYCLSSSILAFI
ncbi:MAG: phosphatase PAP2 family protein [Methylocystis sp.]